MPWWSWMVIGAVLLGAELFFIEADFYLVFLGLSAFLVGLAGLIVPSLAIWLQWLLFAILALVSMTIFRRRVYAMIRGSRPDMQDDLIGQVVRISESLAPDETCRVEHHGSTWTARNVGQAIIESGSKARVIGVDGVLLKVERVG